MSRPRDLWTRRRMLGLSGSVLGGTFLAGCSSSANENGQGGTPTTTETATDAESETTVEPTTDENEAVDTARISLRKLGGMRFSTQPPHGGHSEAVVRPDGRYAVVGTKWGADGTYLVDLADPNTPRRVHYVPGPDDAPTMDVKVDHRDGLYYRTIEDVDVPGNFEVIDYGFRVGAPKNPRIVGRIDEGKSHNVTPHLAASVLYTVNYYEDEDTTGGFDVYDVSDPTTPRELGVYGPEGACHDITVDPKRNLLHAAYQGGEFVGYVFFDVSAPRNPVEIGRFDYDDRPGYDDVEIGQPGFDSAHHTDFDPRRELVFAGDERPYGNPGGKHVFDVGWRDGSFSNPIPIGYTLSPNAQYMREDGNGDGEDDRLERLDWTGHHFDVIPYGERTLLVSADWHEGVCLYDVTDPTNPRPIDRYPTADGANAIEPNSTLAELGGPPMAWSAVYNPARDLVVVSDSFTGLYTFEVTPRRR